MTFDLRRSHLPKSHIQKLLCILLLCPGSAAMAAGEGAAENLLAASRSQADLTGRRGSEYRSQFKAYKDEIRAVGKSVVVLPSQRNTETAGGATRLMPPLPDKKIEYQDQSSVTGMSMFSGNALILKRPALSGLIRVNEILNPLALEATSAQSVGLHDLLQLTVANNLDIAIAANKAQAQKFRSISALGQFLPDLSLSDSQYWLNGRVGVPLNGSLRSSLGGSRTLRLTGPITLGSAGFTHHLYQGGQVMFGYLKAKHELNASRSQFHADYSDTLLAVAQKYYDLVLAEAVLQIRIRAADTSEEQVRINSQNFDEGLATNLDVLQSRTQLALDRQSLLDQQIVRRQASINLTALINYDLAADIAPAENVTQLNLVSTKLPMSKYLQTALLNRPELKRYAELRKSAKSQIAVVGAKLQPIVDLTGNVLGVGRTPGTTEALYLLGLNINWQLGGLGVVDSANVAAAKVEARNASLAVQQEIIKVSQDVRNSYLSCAAAEQNIIETDSQVTSSLEELRLSRLRYQNGVGRNIDILTGQRDYTQAQINKASAIVNLNKAQIQFVRNLGLVSVANLSSLTPVLQ